MAESAPARMLGNSKLMSTVDIGKNQHQEKNAGLELKQTQEEDIEQLSFLPFLLPFPVAHRH